jgi:hypothetical protein
MVDSYMNEKILIKLPDKLIKIIKINMGENNCEKISIHIYSLFYVYLLIQIHDGSIARIFAKFMNYLSGFEREHTIFLKKL